MSEARETNGRRAHRMALAWRSVMEDLKRWPFELAVNVILASPLVPRIVRAVLLRAVGMQIEAYGIYPRCTFRTTRMRVGKGVVINTGCYFDNDVPIEIGANVGIGMQVTFVTSTHKIGPSTLRAGKIQLLPISVADGCWIGARATILPGVTIGRGCIVAAGSVVTGDCAPYGVYAGVPARRVRELSDDSRGCMDDRT